MRKKWLSIMGALTLSIALALTGCGSSTSTEKASSGAAGGGIKQGGSMTFALPGDITSLDAAFSYDFTTNPVVTQITEGLLKFNAKGEVVPLLAEKVDNPDPLTYVYHLRQGVKFQDGSPMTADDVVFSMERTKDPKTASYLGWMYANVDKIQKVDDSTVKVTLKNADALWRYVPATTAGHILSKAYYEAHKANYGKPDGGVMGTGPFKYVSWETGSQIKLAKNEYYWDKTGGPYLDEVVYKVLPEGTTRVTGLKTGQVGMTLDIPLDLLSVVQGMNSVALQTGSSYMNDFIAFNTQRKPFDDVKVRQAMNYALDKQKILDQIIKDAGSPAKAIPIGPAMWVFEKDAWESAYKEIPDYAFNLDKAKQLMAESTVPSGFNAKIVTDNNTVRLNSALALQAAVKPLNINLEIVKVTPEELNTRAFGGARDYDIIVTAWGSDFPDPSGNLTPVFHSANVGDGGSNFGNYKNPQVDALLDEQVKLSDDKKRSELMIQAEKLIANDSPWIMIDHPKHLMALNKDLTGYDVTALWYWDSFMKDIHYVK